MWANATAGKKQRIPFPNGIDSPFIIPFSNLSNVERDKVPPPANRKAIDCICDALGLAKTDPRRDELFDLAAKSKNRIPADVADAVKEQPGIPVLVRTVANKQLSEKKLRELAEYIKKFY